MTDRRIDTVEELSLIMASGVGFVADPFKRRWHTATCPRLARMTLGEPKWFAPDQATLDAYLRSRLESYPTAKLILPCAICGTKLAGATNRPPAAALREATADASTRPPVVRSSFDGFEVWADEIVQNQPRSESAKALRALIGNELKALPNTSGRILAAARRSTHRRNRRREPPVQQHRSIGVVVSRARRTRRPVRGPRDPGAAPR